jgi:hypothetical protein
MAKVGRKPYAEDLSGRKFGSLKVVCKAAPDKSGNSRWACKCDCGNITLTRRFPLLSGKTISCGCKLREKKIKHGGYKTRLYSIWGGMKDRCYREKNIAYKRYGGRGITVCDEWKNDFAAFRDWALSHGYGDTLTIDRIDSDGNYEPNNCRWATYLEQENNSSNCTFIEYGGKRMSLADWAREVGLSYETVSNRYHKGLPIEKVLFSPYRDRSHRGEKL